MRNLSEMTFNAPMVFIDLETTGANFARDRILEIGLVEVSSDGASEWSTLIDPGVPVSSFITGLTGIDDAMVAGAPAFERIATELRERLQGKLLVAHNARFDYGFLKAEFARLGVDFRSPVLCTVKLSRKLAPKAARHNLDTLIERHGIVVGARHRALADAQVLWHLWQAWHGEFGQEAVAAAVASLVTPTTLPEFLDPALAEDLPEVAGAYALYDENDETLLVGRASNLRSKVFSLFADGRSAKAPANQVRQIRWRPAAGEFGARLAELGFKRREQPSPVYAWKLAEHAPGDFRPTLVNSDECDFGRDEHLYGLYNTAKEARQALRKLAEAHFLCPRLLGTEPAKAAAPDAPCSAVRTKQCRGACFGKEPLSKHSARLMTALARLKVQIWPYSGPIAVVESDEFGMLEDFHLFDGWRYFGCVDSEEALLEKLENNKEINFDSDVYRCFLKYIQGSRLRIISSLAARSPAR